LHNKLIEAASSSSLIAIMSFLRFVNIDETQRIVSATKELLKTSKGQDIAYILSSYLQTKHPFWRNCAASSIQGFASFVEQGNPELSQHTNLFTENAGVENSWRENDKSFGCCCKYS
jgi:hypothetical protein